CCSASHDRITSQLRQQLTSAPPPPLTFFFTPTPPTEIYTLSLHDALPISPGAEDLIQSCLEKLYSLLTGQEFPYETSKEAELVRSEEHTSELQSPCNLVCRLLLEKKKMW